MADLSVLGQNFLASVYSVSRMPIWNVSAGWTISMIINNLVS